MQTTSPPAILTFTRTALNCLSLEILTKTNSWATVSQTFSWLPVKFKTNFKLIKNMKWAENGVVASCVTVLLTPSAQSHYFGSFDPALVAGQRLVLVTWDDWTFSIKSENNFPGRTGVDNMSPCLTAKCYYI